MTRWLLLGAAYAWLGFTVGYFFRKGWEGLRGGALRDAGAAGGELVDWIDEDGRLQETVPRAEMRRRNLLHRVTHTYVFHPDGRVFVQQRTRTKDVYPGLFDVCVGGTVVSGESFASNAFRELHEEMGVRGVPLHPLFRHRFSDAHTNNLIQVYACCHGGPFRLQPEEVAGGDWQTLDQVEALIAAEKLCPDSAAGWRLFRQAYPGPRPFDALLRQVAPLAPPEEFS